MTRFRTRGARPGPARPHPPVHAHTYEGKDRR